MNRHQKNRSKEALKVLRLSAVIAVVYSLCFFRNDTGAGIASTYFAVFLAGFFWWYIATEKNRKMKFWDIIFGIIMILLGVIPAYTDNSSLIDGARVLFVLIVIKWSVQIAYDLDSLDLMRNFYLIPGFIVEVFAQIFTPTDQKEEIPDVQLLEYKIVEEVNEGSSRTEENETFSDPFTVRESKQDSSGRKQILLGVLFALPVLLLVLILLAGADPVFAWLFSHLMLRINGLLTLLFWLLHLLVTYLVVYGCAKSLIYRKVGVSAIQRRKIGLVTGITFTSIFAVVYVMFCFVQFFTLMTDGSMLPLRHTYSSYARYGFFELIAVCLINILMVILCRLKFEINAMMKFLLTVISICTCMMDFACAYRMSLYIRHYRLTFARVWVLFILAVILSVMLLLICFIFNEKIKLYEYSLLIICVLFLVFAGIRPDVRIASYNLRHMSETSGDPDYLLSRLPMDAAEILLENQDILVRHQKEYEDDVEYQEKLEWYCEKIVKQYEQNERRSIRRFNWSRYRAYRKARSFIDK